MCSVWLAGDHLCGKWLLTWLSLVMFLIVSYFVLSYFLRDVLDEIWDCIESVPENFPTYQCIYCPHWDEIYIIHQSIPLLWETGCRDSNDSLPFCPDRPTKAQWG